MSCATVWGNEPGSAMSSTRSAASRARSSWATLNPCTARRTARSEPGQREGRVRAGGERQMEALRQPLEQEVHRMMDGVAPYGLILVKHQHDLPLELRQLVEQQGERHVSDVHAPRFERPGGVPADL